MNDPHLTKGVFLAQTMNDKMEKDKFEELDKIKILRQLASIEEEDKGEWKITRKVISDIHMKILWARYGYEQAEKEVEKVSREKKIKCKCSQSSYKYNKKWDANYCPNCNELKKEVKNG